MTNLDPELAAFLRPRLDEDDVAVEGQDDWTVAHTRDYNGLVRNQLIAFERFSNDAEDSESIRGLVGLFKRNACRFRDHPDFKPEWADGVELDEEDRAIE